MGYILKTGILKSDLYLIVTDYVTCIEDSCIINTGEFEVLLEEFKKNFELIEEAGSVFYLYEEDGEFVWMDKSGFIRMDLDWGEINLFDVKIYGV